MKIEIKNVKKSFGEFQALKDIDITFEDGKFTSLLGSSGCGKTTLLRIIAGLETPDEGEIYFDNKCIFSKEKNINIPPEKRNIGFVFQDFALWPHMSVFENVAFGLRARKDTKNLEQRVMDALRIVKLEDFHKRYPHQLSGGQQQRVAFARAIVINPEVILFDEPLSALDAILRQEMRIEIRKIVDLLDITSIFVTHDQLEAMSMSDEIAVLNKGWILQKDTPENIYNNPQKIEIAKFIGNSNWLTTDSMVRPEKVMLSKCEGYEKQLEGVVKNVQFLGASYELSVDCNDNLWTVVSPIRYSKNNKIILYINEKNIINF